MSEEKIIQHTKTAVEIIHSKERNRKHKLKDIALEIIIIVFAVSITLLFHNLNDRWHEKKLVRDFLEGTKEDLKQEAGYIEISLKDFQPTVDYYDTVWQQVTEKRIDARYVDSNSEYLINSRYFSFDNSRFEGFKSSGHLGLIENETLLKHIVYLYTVLMPFEAEADKIVFQQRANGYDTYIGVKAETDAEGRPYISKLLNEPAVKYQVSKYRMYLDERQKSKQKLLVRIHNLIAELDKELQS
jgi:hypothetical protein